jgi:hypothetical protein
MRSLIVAGLVWLASFGALYLFSLQKLGSRADLIDYWERMHRAFMIIGPGGPAWIREKAGELLLLPSLAPLSMMLAAVLIGIIYLAFRNWQIGLMLTIPIVATASASALKLYPFADRLILFLVPQIIFIAAIGIDALSQIKWSRAGVGLAVLGIVVLCAHPIRWNIALLLRPDNFEKEDFRDVLVEVLKSPECRQIVVYETARNHYQYYHRYRYLDTESRAIIAKESDIKSMSPGAESCLWLLQSHVTEQTWIGLHRALQQQGYRIERNIKKIGADAFLFQAGGTLR